jgi:hypothetical protein
MEWDKISGDFQKTKNLDYYLCIEEVCTDSAKTPGIIYSSFSHDK